MFGGFSPSGSALYSPAADSSGITPAQSSRADTSAQPRIAAIPGGSAAPSRNVQELHTTAVETLDYAQRSQPMAAVRPAGSSAESHFGQVSVTHVSRQPENSDFKPQRKDSSLEGTSLHSAKAARNSSAASGSGYATATSATNSTSGASADTGTVTLSSAEGYVDGQSAGTAQSPAAADVIAAAAVVPAPLTAATGTLSVYDDLSAVRRTVSAGSRTSHEDADPARKQVHPHQSYPLPNPGQPQPQAQFARGLNLAPSLGIQPIITHHLQPRDAPAPAPVPPLPVAVPQAAQPTPQLLQGAAAATLAAPTNAGYAINSQV
jgi:hypothetical protein